MPDDRDQLFEKALARHLRADGAAESLCLDPETLAAYHQCTLSPEELSAAKSHIVSCARCQEILAHLEATEEIADVISDPQSELEPVAPLPAGSPASRAHPTHERALVATPASIRSAAPRKAAPVAPKRSFLLLWMAPAGAIAAGLLFLAGLREFRSAAPQSPIHPPQVAENRAPAPAPQGSSAMMQSLEKDKTLRAEPNELHEIQVLPPAAAPMARNENALRDDKKESAGRSSGGGKPELSTLGRPASGAIPRRQTAGPSAAAGQAQAADAIQQSVPSTTDQAQVALNADKVAPPQAPPLDARAARTSATPAIGRGQGNGNAPAPASAPPPPPSPTAADNFGVSAGAVQSEVVTKAQAPEVAAYSRAANKIGLDIRILAPGGTKIWSIGPNGQILYSKDSGHSWLPQTSGVSANLIAGSAPSGKVCWIAGAAGTLLRTTDSGAHWQQISTPISGDLGGVHAADAQHASVWDVPNRLSYETSDGGATWTQRANE